MEKDEKEKIISQSTIKDSISSSLKGAKEEYFKSMKYNRELYEDKLKMNSLKKNTFAEKKIVKDPYTGKKLTLTKKEALQKYGTIDVNSETDHISSIKETFEQYKKNPWVTDKDIKEVVNSDDNLQVVSQKFNRTKRDKTNTKFEEYLNTKKKDFLSEEAKEMVKKDGELAKKTIDKKLKNKAIKNVATTYHNAGIEGAKNAGSMTLTISGLLNVIDFINGKKSLEEALYDVSVNTGKAAVLGYVTSGTATVVSHTLDSTFSNSSSSFLKKLGESNVPAKAITTVIIIGDTIKKYVSGELSTKECLLELGEKGATFAAISPAMAMGQACIPIPVVGAAVGALIGSIITSGICQNIKRVLYNRELQEQHEKLITEYKEILKYQKIFRKDLDIVLSNYLRDYENCFNESLIQIGEGFKLGNINQMIEGANKITRKLNGEVKFENIDEFKTFFMDEKIDIF